MGRAAKKTTSDEVTQEAVTAPQPRCPKTGRPLDQWGLPLNGPARVAALEAVDMPDPRDEPEVWERVGTLDPADLPGMISPPSEPVIEPTPLATVADEPAKLTDTETLDG